MDNYNSKQGLLPGARFAKPIVGTALDKAVQGDEGGRIIIASPFPVPKPAALPKVLPLPNLVILSTLTNLSPLNPYLGYDRKLQLLFSIVGDPGFRPLVWKYGKGKDKAVHGLFSWGNLYGTTDNPDEFYDFVNIALLTQFPTYLRISNSVVYGDVLESDTPVGFTHKTTPSQGFLYRGYAPTAGVLDITTSSGRTNVVNEGKTSLGLLGFGTWLDRTGSFTAIPEVYSIQPAWYATFATESNTQTFTANPIARVFTNATPGWFAGSTFVGDSLTKTVSCTNLDVDGLSFSHVQTQISDVNLAIPAASVPAIPDGIGGFIGTQFIPTAISGTVGLEVTGVIEGIDFSETLDQDGNIVAATSILNYTGTETTECSINISGTGVYILEGGLSPTENDYAGIQVTTYTTSSNTTGSSTGTRNREYKAFIAKDFTIDCFDNETYTVNSGDTVTSAEPFTSTSILRGWRYDVESSVSSTYTREAFFAQGLQATKDLDAVFWSEYEYDLAIESTKDETCRFSRTFDFFTGDNYYGIFPMTNSWQHTTYGYGLYSLLSFIGSTTTNTGFSLVRTIPTHEASSRVKARIDGTTYTLNVPFPYYFDVQRFVGLISQEPAEGITINIVNTSINTALKHLTYNPIINSNALLTQGTITSGFISNSSPTGLVSNLETLERATTSDFDALVGQAVWVVTVQEGKLNRYNGTITAFNKFNNLEAPFNQVLLSVALGELEGNDKCFLGLNKDTPNSRNRLYIVPKNGGFTACVLYNRYQNSDQVNNYATVNYKSEGNVIATFAPILDFENLQNLPSTSFVDWYKFNLDTLQFDRQKNKVTRIVKPKLDGVDELFNPSISSYV